MATGSELSKEDMVVLGVTLANDGRIMVSVGREPQQFVTSAAYPAGPVSGSGQPFYVDKDKAPKIGDAVEVIVRLK